MRSRTSTYLQSIISGTSRIKPVRGNTMTATSNAPATASNFPEGFNTTWWISNWIFGVWSVYMVESILRALRMFVDVTHILYSSFPYCLRRLKRSYEFPCLLQQSSLHLSVPWSVSCQKVLVHRPKSLLWRNEEACLRKALPPSSSSDPWVALVARIWGGFRESHSSRCLNSWGFSLSARIEVTKARIYSHGCIARPSLRVPLFYHPSMTSIGTGYDLSASTYSPDGRIFQVRLLREIEQVNSLIRPDVGRICEQSRREFWVRLSWSECSRTEIYMNNTTELRLVSK